MTTDVNVQYIGFKANEQDRDYNFIVHRALNETSEFTITIGNEAFSSGGVRFQDAPGICSQRLHRELATFANNPPLTKYRISKIDLDDFITAHPQPRHYLSKTKAPVGI